MDFLQELRIHVGALVEVVNRDEKFFAPVIHYVRRLEQLLAATQDDVSQEELKMLTDNIERFYSEYRPAGGDDIYIPPTQTANSDNTVQEINRIVGVLCSLPEEDFKGAFPPGRGAKAGKTPAEPSSPSPECIFIGHGRSKLWARLKIFLEEELCLATVTYESESRVGKSIVPVIEKMLGQATFAVLVLTAEDETAEGTKRARQNVVHEAGLFQGKLGFDRAVLLVQKGMEGFTNVDGLQHIPFDAEAIEQTFYELTRVLRREKLVS
jgi:hypothetical protein